MTDPGSTSRRPSLLGAQTVVRISNRAWECPLCAAKAIAYDDDFRDTATMPHLCRGFRPEEWWLQAAGKGSER